MTKPIHWGIIGLGKIAHKFASDLQLSENAKLQGVASRSMEKAREFGDQYNSASYYDSYEALATDPEVEVIYIATPHTLHFENTMMCLKHGKAVLCEKPMGINGAQVKTMIDEASSRKLFLMEALWTQFLPATKKVIGLLEDQAIGDLQFVRADFGFKSPVDFEGRLYNKQLGGGSLLDIGIYPIYLSLLTLGKPTGIKAMARMTETNVDAFCAMLFDYENAAKAVLDSTIEADTPTEGYIYGSKGTIKMHSRFHESEKVSLYKNGELKQEFNLPVKGFGYFHEIEHVNNCLQNNKLESDKFPHQISIDLITIIDRVKAEIGLQYNGE